VGLHESEISAKLLKQLNRKCGTMDSEMPKSSLISLHTYYLGYRREMDYRAGAVIEEKFRSESMCITILPSSRYIGSDLNGQGYSSGQDSLTSHILRQHRRTVKVIQLFHQSALLRREQVEMQVMSSTHSEQEDIENDAAEPKLHSGVEASADKSIRDVILLHGRA